jgi:hypothetical protein
VPGVLAVVSGHLPQPQWLVRLVWEILMAVPEDSDCGLVLEWGTPAGGPPAFDPPPGAFIAAVPFLKMLGKSDLPWPMRFVPRVVDGAPSRSEAKPRGRRARGGAPA